MACHYFQKGYFGVCTASELGHVPSITEMENYCFKKHYSVCPIFEDFITKRYKSGETGMKQFARSSHHQEET